MTGFTGQSKQNNICASAAVNLRFACLSDYPRPGVSPVLCIQIDRINSFGMHNAEVTGLVVIVFPFVISV